MNEVAMEIYHGELFTLMCVHVASFITIYLYTIYFYAWQDGLDSRTLILQKVGRFLDVSNCDVIGYTLEQFLCATICCIHFNNCPEISSLADILSVHECTNVCQ